MREILFRGKRVDNGKWVYGSFIPDLMEVYYGGKDLDGFIKPFGKTKEERVMVEVERNTVGQYTGLTDKNGTRIFEGDIIKSEQDGMIGVIRFGEYQTTNSGNGECHLGFSIEWYGKYSDLLRKDLGWWISLKIIGNIYDNPELLKGE